MAIFNTGEIQDTVFLVGVSICQKGNWIGQARNHVGSLEWRTSSPAPSFSVGLGTSPGGDNPFVYLLDLRPLLIYRTECHFSFFRNRSFRAIESKKKKKKKGSGSKKATKCCWFEREVSWLRLKAIKPPKQYQFWINCQWEVVACWLFLDILSTGELSSCLLTN